MPTTYKHLSSDERDLLAVLKSNGRSLREIAGVLRRDPSTLSRELRRNVPPVYTGYYLAHKAQERADKRAQDSRRHPRLKHRRLRRYVEDRIRSGWSPELIAGRLKRRHAGAPRRSSRAIGSVIGRPTPWSPGKAPRPSKSQSSARRATPDWPSS